MRVAARPTLHIILVLLILRTVIIHNGTPYKKRIKALKPADAASTDYLLAGLDVSVGVARLLHNDALEGVRHAVAVQVI